LRGETVTLFKAGNVYAQRDFTFVNDTVKGIVASMGRTKGANHEVINLGKGSAETIKEMVNILSKLLGRDAVTEDGLLHVADVPSTHADLSLARQLLEYRPQVTLEKGLSDWCDWYFQYYNISKSKLQK